jgi:hypothetical protein
MVIIVREDLGMRPGKVATQAAHSCVGLFNKLHVKRQGIAQAWMVRIMWLSFQIKWAWSFFCDCLGERVDGQVRASTDLCFLALLAGNWVAEDDWQGHEWGGYDEIPETGKGQVSQQQQDR